MQNPCSVINDKGEIVKNVYLSELAAWERNGYRYYDPNVAPMPKTVAAVPNPKKGKKAPIIEPTPVLVEVDTDDSSE